MPYREKSDQEKITDNSDIEVETYEEDVNGCTPLDINILGLISLTGQICPAEPSLDLCITLLGECLEGDPTNELEFTVNLIVISGSITFYLNEGCLEIGFNLQTPWGFEYDGSAQICF
ncbi:5938_t:CDS:2 [Acaulospora morrowiae]|uniref:5938_t:CDS:1 n=1 Tax=Acaulospora morrowiae TaxID=94023 RepID=A0A9N9G5B1_9GLOM|nr:5938_t:CDS:2 [Acaulospora morrowiae]